MSADNDKGQTDKKVIHLDIDERLPAVPGSSQAAEVLKQIIEQILANERRRARIEFLRISVLFLVFLAAVLATGTWFAHQLLTQLREERQLTEQSWRLAAGRLDDLPSPYPAARSIPSRQLAAVALRTGGDTKDSEPTLNHEAIAKLEQNTKTMAELLQAKPSDSSATIRDMLGKQQQAIQALNARLNETHHEIAGGEQNDRTVSEEKKHADFIAVPIAESLKLRMPIPSL